MCVLERVGEGLLTLLILFTMGQVFFVSIRSSCELANRGLGYHTEGLECKGLTLLKLFTSGYVSSISVGNRSVNKVLCRCGEW